MLATFFARFPTYTVIEKPTPSFIARYHDRVPPELVELWEQYGFGTYCEGYLKAVNPEEYADLLAGTYQLTSTPVQAPALVLFTTAMGDLLIWEDGFVSVLNYRHSQTDVFSLGLEFFFGDLATGSALSRKLHWEPYLTARARLGEPAYDECFGYVPLLALGGPETADHLEKVKLREHIALIGQFTGLLER